MLVGLISILFYAWSAFNLRARWYLFLVLFTDFCYCGILIHFCLYCRSLDLGFLCAPVKQSGQIQSSPGPKLIFVVGVLPAHRFLWRIIVSHLDFSVRSPAPCLLTRVEPRFIFPAPEIFLCAPEHRVDSVRSSTSEAIARFLGFAASSRFLSADSVFGFPTACFLHSVISRPRALVFGERASIHLVFPNRSWASGKSGVSQSFLGFSFPCRWFNFCFSVCCTPDFRTDVVRSGSTRVNHAVQPGVLELWLCRFSSFFSSAWKILFLPLFLLLVSSGQNLSSSRYFSSAVIGLQFVVSCFLISPLTAISSASSRSVRVRPKCLVFCFKFLSWPQMLLNRFAFLIWWKLLRVIPDIVLEVPD
jgi:hypothetical protein